MKKILSYKTDTADDIVQKINKIGDRDIVLVIPKGSRLHESPAEFKLIKENAAEAGKSLAIESVDEEILKLARKSGLEAHHPFLSGAAGVSDIIIPARKKTGRKISEKKETAGAAEVEGEKTLRIEIQPEELKFEKKTSNDASPRQKNRPVRFFKYIASVAAAAAGAVFVANAFFAWANVSLTFRQISWSKSLPVSADKNLNVSSDDSVPAEVFISSKNVTRIFSANSVQTVSAKAAGVVIIYSEYSASPQPLVATTRFQTKDGKIYRLTSAVTVPPAAKKEGRLQASAIEAEIKADKIGPEYNTVTDEKLSIPGFAGTPKFLKFYGIIKSMEGGGVGQKKVAGDAEIEAAKQKTIEVLKTSLSNNFLNNRPDNFIIPDGAYDFQVTKIAVSSGLDEKGNYTVFAAGRYRAIGFREEDLLKIMHDRAAPDVEPALNSDFTWVSKKFSYKDVKSDFESGKLTMTVSFEGAAEPVFSKDSLAAKLVKQPLPQARTIVSTLPGLDKATLSVWPFWLRTLPAGPDRIKIEIGKQ